MIDWIKKNGNKCSVSNSDVSITKCKEDGYFNIRFRRNVFKGFGETGYVKVGRHFGMLFFDKGTKDTGFKLASFSKDGKAASIKVRLNGIENLNYPIDAEMQYDDWMKLYFIELK